MRPSEPRTWFTPADDPAHGDWFTRDPGAIAAALKLERAAPFTVDADAEGKPGDLPQGGETILAFPNDHLSYALTWFGMALALAGVFCAYAISRVRTLPPKRHASDSSGAHPDGGQAKP
jgi:surfeit locus 1 family protein